MQTESRQITDHIVPGDSANHQLKIFVTDEPGAGGANHRYEVAGMDTTDNPSRSAGERYVNATSMYTILFQNGPIKENGVNGITGEALIAIEIDRLRSFQKGPYACRENALALTAFEEGLMWLQKRTRDRMARGVEGTHEK